MSIALELKINIKHKHTTKDLWPRQGSVSISLQCPPLLIFLSASNLEHHLELGAALPPPTAFNIFIKVT